MLVLGPITWTTKVSSNLMSLLPVVLPISAVENACLLSRRAIPAKIGVRLVCDGVLGSSSMYTTTAQTLRPKHQLLTFSVS